MVVLNYVFAHFETQKTPKCSQFVLKMVYYSIFKINLVDDPAFWPIAPFDSFDVAGVFPDFVLLSPLWGGFPVGPVKMPDSSGLTSSCLHATRTSDTTTLFDKPNTPLQATFEHSDMPRPHNSLPSGILRLFIFAFIYLFIPF